MALPGPLKELADPLLWRDCICELVGTFYLLVAHSILGMHFSEGPTPLIVAALGTGFVIFILVETLAEMSGGHINPAVSIAFAACRIITPLKAVFFVIMQVAGGMAGSGIIYWISPDQYISQMQPLALRPNVTAWQGFVAEVVQTALLLLVACAVLDHKNRVVRLPSLAIGFTVAANILMFGKMTGGCMNPVVAFSVALVRGIWKTHHWIYWAGTILGGIIGGCLYTYVLAMITQRFSPQPDKLKHEKHTLLLETIQELLSGTQEQEDENQNIDVKKPLRRHLGDVKEGKEADPLVA